MCGRFVQSGSIDDYVSYFGAGGVRTESLEANYNVAPTDRVYAIAEYDGERLLGSFGWGLIPHWARDRKGAARMINARDDSVADKPAFRDSFRKRRCIIPADGFYEWVEREGMKIPHYFFLESHAPMALAGIWANWKDPDTGEWVRTCSVVTTGPNKLTVPIHDRMPAILAPSAWDLWLDRTVEDPAAVLGLLGPAEDASMAEYEVSTYVNSVRNNGPDCIVPVGD
jgi:putative SOS response-associated peptidase YedK